jgi:hypothetical protein
MTRVGSQCHSKNKKQQLCYFLFFPLFLNTFANFSTICSMRQHYLAFCLVPSLGQFTFFIVLCLSIFMPLIPNISVVTYTFGTRNIFFAILQTNVTYSLVSLLITSCVRGAIDIWYLRFSFLSKNNFPGLKFVSPCIFIQFK